MQVAGFLTCGCGKHHQLAGITEISVCSCGQELNAIAWQQAQWRVRDVLSRNPKLLAQEMSD